MCKALLIIIWFLSAAPPDYNPTAGPPPVTDAVAMCHVYHKLLLHLPEL